MNKLYLEQNNFKVIETTDKLVTTKLFGQLYNIYLEVTCPQCGAPLIAIKDIDSNNIPIHLPFTGCSNLFCRDYILKRI